MDSIYTDLSTSHLHIAQVSVLELNVSYCLYHIPQRSKFSSEFNLATREFLEFQNVPKFKFLCKIIIII